VAISLCIAKIRRTAQYWLFLRWTTGFFNKRHKIRSAKTIKKWKYKRCL